MEYWHYSRKKKERKKDRFIWQSEWASVRKKTPRHHIPYHNANIPPAEKLPVLTSEEQPLCSTCSIKPTDKLIPNDWPKNSLNKTFCFSTRRNYSNLQQKPVASDPRVYFCLKICFKMILSSTHVSQCSRS